MYSDDLMYSTNNNNNNSRKRSKRRLRRHQGGGNSSADHNQQQFQQTPQQQATEESVVCDFDIALQYATAHQEEPVQTFSPLSNSAHLFEMRPNLLNIDYCSTSSSSSSSSSEESSFEAGGDENDDEFSENGNKKDPTEIKNNVPKEMDDENEIDLEDKPQEDDDKTQNNTATGAGDQNNKSKRMTDQKQNDSNNETETSSPSNKNSKTNKNNGGNIAKSTNEIDAYSDKYDILSQIINIRISGDEEERLKNDKNIDDHLFVAGNVKFHLVSERTIVVESAINAPPLGEGTLLVCKMRPSSENEKDVNLVQTFNIPILLLGKVYETFGAVIRPHYAIRLPPPSTKKGNSDKTKINKKKPSSDMDDQGNKAQEQKISSDNDNNESKSLEAKVDDEKDNKVNKEEEHNTTTTSETSINREEQVREEDPWSETGKFTKFLKENKNERVYYVEDIASVIDTDAVLRKSGKGCDASNIYDEELDVNEVEYSDDEEERRAKQVARNSHKGVNTSPNNTNNNNNDKKKSSNSTARRMNNNNTNINRGGYHPSGIPIQPIQVMPSTMGRIPSNTLHDRFNRDILTQNSPSFPHGMPSPHQGIYSPQHQLQQQQQLLWQQQQVQQQQQTQPYNMQPGMMPFSPGQGPYFPPPPSQLQHAQLFGNAMNSPPNANFMPQHQQLHHPPQPYLHQQLHHHQQQLSTMHPMFAGQPPPPQAQQVAYNPGNHYNTGPFPPNTHHKQYQSYPNIYPPTIHPPAPNDTKNFNQSVNSVTSKDNNNSVAPPQNTKN